VLRGCGVRLTRPTITSHERPEAARVSGVEADASQAFGVVSPGGGLLDGALDLSALDLGALLRGALGMLASREVLVDQAHGHRSLADGGSRRA
jgi:hypothetical protein